MRKRFEDPAQRHLAVGAGRGGVLQGADLGPAAVRAGDAVWYDDHCRVRYVRVGGLAESRQQHDEWTRESRD